MARKQKQKEVAFLWEKLSLEMQSSVLGWLPLRQLLRSKSVCKLWKSIISASSFTHFPSLLSRPTYPPWLIFVTPQSFDSLLAFDFEDLSWFTFDMGFLSSILDSMPGSSSSAPSAQHDFVWCSGSASGLLLLDFNSSLHVCNPLTKFLFKLPPFKSIEVAITQGFSNTHLKINDGCTPTHTHTTGYDGIGGLSTNTHIENHVSQGVSSSTHMENNGEQRFLSTTSIGDNAEDADYPICTHRHSHDYTLIAIGRAKGVLAIEAYCADSNSWNIVGSMPISFIIRHDQMMECNGLFYGLLLKPLGMLVVGENDGPIWRIQKLPVDYCRGKFCLLACQNAILMLCPAGEPCGFVIWRFQPHLRSWIKMLKMPDYILQDVKSVSDSNWEDCVGVGNFICFRAVHSFRVLAYDICNDLWSWLPEPSHAYDSFWIRGLQFQPRLDYRLSL